MTRVPFLDLHAQYLSIKRELDDAITEVIAETTFIRGPAVERFEVEFARYQEAKHCIGVGNGTDALEIALVGLDLPPDSEVIVPANSFIATSEAVTTAGLRVVFADVLPDTFNLDPGSVRSVITERTSAIIAVHLYGQPCALDEIGKLATEHDLTLIEDAAQAHGAEFRGRRVGGFGAVGTFSFYPGKNLGAFGDGGAIVTNREDLAVRCRMIANHGRVAKYDHQFEGRNSRLDGIQGAVLGVKLRYLDEWIDTRNEVAQTYFEGLSGIPGLRLPEVRPDVRHAFHLFVVRTVARDALRDHLASRGIETGIHYPIALPDLEAYRSLAARKACPVSKTQAGELLSLPIGEHLDCDQVSRVVAETRGFFGLA